MRFFESDIGPIGNWKFVQSEIENWESGSLLGFNMILIGLNMFMIGFNII